MLEVGVFQENLRALPARVRTRLGDVRSGLGVTFGSALSWVEKSQPQLIGVWTQTRQQGRREGLGSRSVTITFAVRQSTFWHDFEHEASTHRKTGSRRTGDYE